MIDVVTGLAIRDGLVLMAQRRITTARPGMWEYPGGKVEDGEDQEQAIVREWKEELDVNVLGRPRIIDTALVLRLEKTYRVYLIALAFHGEPKPLAAQEIRWVDPSHAVVELPMVPSSYWFYPAVLRELRLRELRG